MKSRNSELRARARQSLSGKWGSAVLVSLVYLLILFASGLIPIILFVTGILVMIPIRWGFTVLFLSHLRGEKIEVERMFDGFKNYGRILGTQLLAGVYVFLWTLLWTLPLIIPGVIKSLSYAMTPFILKDYPQWTLLLIIPGVIKSLSYAMTPYILKDYPQLSFNAAIEKSMEMMDGYKMKLFLLILIFIGWFILCILLTLGIGLLWFIPYATTSYAAFYEELKQERG